MCKKFTQNSFCLSLHRTFIINLINMKSKKERVLESTRIRYSHSFFTLGLALMCSFPVNADNMLLGGGKISNYQEINQQRSVSGQVLDENREPMIGVSILVKGTKVGAITDFDGKFKIDAPAGAQELQITYMGYKSKTVKITSGNILVKMEQDNQLLDEVVVVGYGTVKKRDLTGAVSSVKSEDIVRMPTSNVIEAIQGQVAGLDITRSSGEAGSAVNMTLRGTRSINGDNTPLFIIDGMEGSYDELNPNDIESVSVLKDAASASIYGARAAFGVILVQTKKGKAGKARVNYGVNVRFSDAVTVPEMLDSYRFAQYFNRAAENVGAGAIFSAEALQRIQDYQAGKLTTVCTINENTNRWNNYGGANANTDWFKEFYDDWVPSQEHNVSIAGGTEKIQYTLSGSFMDQNGLLRHGDDNLQRYTVNSNITANVTDWFKVSYSTKWTRENFERPSYLTGLFFHNIARRWPTCPAYDPNGYPMDGVEIIQLEDGGKQRNEKDLNTQQLQLIFEPIKNWTIHLEGALRTTNTRQHWEVLPVYAHDVDGNPYAVQSVCCFLGWRWFLCSRCFQSQ